MSALCCSCGRQLALSFVLLLCISEAMPQGVSILGGANFTSMRDPLGIDHGPHAGHAATGAGYLLGIAFGPEHPHPWNICVEARFTQCSVGYNFDETSGGYLPVAFTDGVDRGRRSMRYRAVELPVLLVHRRWPGLRLGLGPYGSRLLNATDTKRGHRSRQGVEVDLDERVDRTSLMAPWEFGAVASALIESNTHLHMDLRYKIGLTNLDRAVGSSPSYTDQFQIALVYDLR